MSLELFNFADFRSQPRNRKISMLRKVLALTKWLAIFQWQICTTYTTSILSVLHNESSKLSAPRAHMTRVLRLPVPYVLPCLTSLMRYVLLFLTCLMLYVLLCLTCLMRKVHWCLTCFVPYLLSYLTCLLPYMLSSSRASCPMCLRASLVLVSYMALLLCSFRVSCASLSVCVLAFPCLTWLIFISYSWGFFWKIYYS